ncbi:MAG: hypothetical protein QW512_06300 [Thermofilaceae archaeon]
MNVQRLKALGRLARAFAKALARAGRRTAQMYLEPFKLVEEVKFSPDASGPAILLSITFAIQTLIAAQLVTGVTIVTNGTRESLLDMFYSNIAGYVSMRAATLFVFWFILFVIYWFIMYLFGSRIEGFTVFSATGYILSSQLLAFSVYFASYVIASRIVPAVELVSQPGAYPRLLALTAYLYRLDLTSSHIGIPLRYLLDAMSYFGTIWNMVLTLLTFKIIGDLSWKKSIAGTAAAMTVSWLLASLFRAAGML